ncbi:hypothetical protein N656DRAFT_35642 [Canariomyces notabilis]|uniref:Uncharacterized protein n=1 Tax=Canariomyces notabilis TaxID=2074819 RepID=A0AAN6TMU5_9PEZI|nr:hypothetical protein N656DRAFT_35642 [Canariomyces arenarius]
MAAFRDSRSGNIFTSKACQSESKPNSSPYVSSVRPSTPQSRSLASSATGSESFLAEGAVQDLFVVQNSCTTLFSSQRKGSESSDGSSSAMAVAGLELLTVDSHTTAW